MLSLQVCRDACVSHSNALAANYVPLYWHTAKCQRVLSEACRGTCTCARRMQMIICNLLYIYGWLYTLSSCADSILGAFTRSFQAIRWAVPEDHLKAWSQKAQGGASGCRCCGRRRRQWWRRSRPRGLTTDRTLTTAAERRPASCRSPARPLERGPLLPGRPVCRTAPTLSMPCQSISLNDAPGLSGHLRLQRFNNGPLKMLQLSSDIDTDQTVASISPL